MKRVHYNILAFLLVVSCMTNGAIAQGICPTTFFAALVQLTPCRTAVTPFTPSPPSEECCSAVHAVGQPCLCKLVSGPFIAGIDPSMAIQLPLKCGVDFEPCNVRP